MIQYVLYALLLLAPTTGESQPVMTAIRVHEHGGPEVLKLEQVPIPAPGEGEMLIRVYAAGVNPIDWKMRQGGGRVRPGAAYTPGFDVAGVVESAGSGVSKFKRDDSVFAMLDLRRVSGGGYAEHAIVKETEAAFKPPKITFNDAAGVPLVSLTAWQAMFDTAHLDAGQTILIHGGAGGVGSMAVQLAHWKGAKVIATASKENHDFLKQLGADQTIDYRTEKFEDVAKDVDVVLDTVGGDTQARSFGVLKKGGMLVSIVGRPDAAKADAAGVRAAGILVHVDAAELAQIATLLDEGKIKPVVTHVFPLADADKAQAQSETRHARGKIVLETISMSMPDPLLMNDGTKVSTPRQWEKRREEMKRPIEDFLTGHAPPPPSNLLARESDARSVANGKANFKLVHLSFGPAEQKLGFDAGVFVPADRGHGPFPTIVHISFYPTPGTTPTPPPIRPTTRPLSTTAATQAAEFRRKFMSMADPDRAAQEYAPALSRGYALIVFNYQQAGADDRDTWKTSAFFPAYPDSDWHDLASWAWAMSRCVDYLQTQSFADKSKLVALGHSRLGKTTLVAGAFDERFALVAPAGSGCAGTGAFRFNGRERGGKEGLEDVVKNFPQWISPRLGEFSHRVHELPFDQHWLIALCAPRAFIAPDALDDSACNGMALKQSYLAAKPVYEFLGVPDKLGVHFRPGKHALADEDWTAVLDFADQQLLGKKIDRRFDQLPPDELLH